MTSDDVKVGQLVAVVKHRCGSNDCDADHSGRPHKVVSVSLPFAVLEDCETAERCPIDLRVWELGKVSRQYVKSMTDCVRKTDCDDDDERERDGHKRCVRCGERLVQRLGTHGGAWYWWCNECEAFKEAVEA